MRINNTVGLISNKYGYLDFADRFCSDTKNIVFLIDNKKDERLEKY